MVPRPKETFTDIVSQSPKRLKPSGALGRKIKKEKDVWKVNIGPVQVLF